MLSLISNRRDSIEPLAECLQPDAVVLARFTHIYGGSGIEQFSDTAMNRRGCVVIQSSFYPTLEHGNGAQCALLSG